MMSRRRGWNSVVSDSIDELMMAVRDRLHVTSVVVTHDMRSARRLGQHVIMLHRGKIHANGPPDEIFNSQDPIVRQFVDGVADPKESLMAPVGIPVSTVIYPQSEVKFISHFITNRLYWVIIKKPANGID